MLKRHQLLGDGAKEAGKRRDRAQEKGELKLKRSGLKRSGLKRSGLKRSGLKRSGLSLFASCKAVTVVEMV